jgi:hypothetical protein
LLVARQITNGHQIRIDAIHRLIGFTMVHRPHSARLMPRQLKAPWGVATSPYTAVSSQQIAQHTARDLREEAAEGR